MKITTAAAQENRQAKRLEGITAKLSARGIELIGDFRKLALTATFKGSCGHYWRATAASVVNSTSNCPICAGRRNRERVQAETRKMQAASRLAD